MQLWDTISTAISEATGEPFSLAESQAVAGGCINTAYRLHGGGRAYFVKLNGAERLAMFEAEADGLKALAAPGVIKVPRPVCSGCVGGQAYLVMEALALGERSDPSALGEGLAALHRHTGEHFGWHRDNVIGATPQLNDEMPDWVTFWRERRLGFQLGLAAQNGASRRLLDDGARLAADLDRLFVGHTPVPSLLHGDLWSGNVAFTRDGEPAIFDPAVYYGDREADIAMTELFGGFSPAFYRAYSAAWPLDDGYPIRKGLYNLYHILNHFNLFGGGYGPQAEGTIGRLLAEIH